LLKSIQQLIIHLTAQVTNISQQIRDQDQEFQDLRAMVEETNQVVTKAGPSTQKSSLLEQMCTKAQEPLDCGTTNQTPHLPPPPQSTLLEHLSGHSQALPCHQTQSSHLPLATQLHQVNVPLAPLHLSGPQQRPLLEHLQR
jgi:hypothetical protein